MGVVFDIQRCGMHDGPGIRTVIFFKGCPLHCKWCHNPESQKKEPQIGFFHEKCIRCGLCASVCVNGAHSFTENGTHIFYPEKCVECGRCIQICPNGSLKLYGTEMNLQQLFSIIEKDRCYYESSGGITVSGGEPFMQAAFLNEILQEAKKRKLHTCVETSGFTSLDRIVEAAPFIDLFLFDCKETDEVRLKAFTGAECSVIETNLEWLCQNGNHVVLRCPLIPGYNAIDSHLHGLCEMERRFPNLEGIEILLYHDMGRGKAAAIGKTYEPECKPFSPKEVIEIKEKLREFGASQRMLDSF